MISKNQIKEVNALHLKKYRDSQKLFIAEGVKICDEIILNHPQFLKELFITKDCLELQSDLIVKQKIKFTIVTENELKKISTLTTPNNMLAVCPFFETNNCTFDFNKQFSLYLDDVRDPGNLGTILRIADWFGIPQIFCSPQTTDVYNPKTIQAAMGAFLRVKVNYCELKDLVQSTGATVYGTLLNGKNMYGEKLKNGLIVIGNESTGISKDNLSFVTHPITIPAATTNKTESLNAAMATAVVCAEFFRQLNH